jgi:hypothetical protein
VTHFEVLLAVGGHSLERSIHANFQPAQHHIDTEGKCELSNRFMQNQHSSSSNIVMQHKAKK